MTYLRYVALGDSFTEGVGDPAPDLPNGVRGWADRFAGGLDRAQPGLYYANLAIRGRKLRQIVADQVEQALTMEPDLVSIYAGANDVLRPAVDVDGLLAEYDDAIGRLTAAGARVIVFTAFDPGSAAVFGALRGRFAIYSELVREIIEKHDATLVDFWRMHHLHDPRFWDEDRMHLSSAGHQQMAISVLDTLEIAHDLEPLTLSEFPPLTPKQRRAEHLRWAKEYASPWVKRRLTGTSSGDGLSPRHPQLKPVGQ